MNKFLLKYIKYKIKYLKKKQKIYGGGIECMSGYFNLCYDNFPKINNKELCVDDNGIISDHMPIISCFDILDNKFNIFTLNFGDATYFNDISNISKSYNFRQTNLSQDVINLLIFNNNRLNKLIFYIKFFQIICLQEISKENMEEIYDKCNDLFYINCCYQTRNRTYIITLMIKIENMEFTRMHNNCRFYLQTTYTYKNIYIDIFNCKFPIFDNSNKSSIYDVLYPIHNKILEILKKSNDNYVILTGDLNIHTNNYRNPESITYLEYLFNLCKTNNICINTYRINKNDYILIFKLKEGESLFYDWDNKISEFFINKKGYKNNTID